MLKIPRRVDDLSTPVDHLNQICRIATKMRAPIITIPHIAAHIHNGENTHHQDQSIV
jgi:hypothetical protein